MATVGHTLIGLSLAGFGPEKRRRGILPYLWPGLLVLMAHVVDLVEWTALFLAPDRSDKRFLTHAPLLAGGLVLVVCLILRLATGIRRPLPYFIVAAAVMSHLVLDHPVVRAFVINTYGLASDDQFPRLRSIVLAEIWLYGLPLLGVAVFLLIRRPDLTPQARRVGMILGLLAILAAASKNAMIWTPAYLIALGAAAYGMRRALSVRWAWSLVPILPLMVFLAFEFMASREAGRAKDLLAQKEYERAIVLYQHVLSYPTRMTSSRTYVELSWCYQNIGDLEAAEAVLLEGRRRAPDDWAALYWLARFYADPRLRETPYHRPEAARDLFRQIRDGPYTRQERAYAESQLADLRRRGWIGD